MARQLAGYLALPIVIVDPAHVVIYYNEPAEQMVGRSFNEAGPIPWAEWAQDFQFTDEAERPIPSTEMPMALALRHRHLAHRRFWLRGLNGVRHHMAETAIPLRSMAGRFLGAVGVFDDVEP